MDYSSIANLPNLGPGSTGADVKKLQDWLVQNGFLTAAQEATGPGTYGPQTTAAVAKWQQQAGFNTQGNPGYFGPLSKTYITQQSTAKAPTSTTTPTTQTQQPTTNASLQKAALSAVADVATSAAVTGKPVVSFAEALSLAAKDPNIVAKYSDALKLDTQSFSQALDQLRTATGTEQQNLQTQFQDERRKLAEASAASGQAYSGFRGRAQKELAQSESGVVSSSRSQLQKNLQDLTTSFEAKYGSGSATPATANFVDPFAASNVSLSGQTTPGAGGTSTLSGQLAGGITGTVAPQKQQDINSSALQSYQTAQFPNV
ncbi:MAG: peptidoglycan-binding domain-containing protein [Patescibacteria group bacterium]